MHNTSYHLTVHLGRILVEVAGLSAARNATLLRAANAVVRGETSVEELGASLEGLSGNQREELTTDVDEHFVKSQKFSHGEASGD